MIMIPETHEDWLKARKIGLGASDAGTVLGVNPWKTNVELWEEKTGRRDAADISDKPQVKYGHEAEQYIRGLFALDHPELVVTYESPYKIIRSDDYRFLFCTPDAELEEKDTGRHGGLEIKTTEIMNPRQWQEWDGRIPETYYAQVCHQMIAAGWEFVWLRAQIKYTSSMSGENRSQMRDYYIARWEVEDDIKTLLEAEIGFWKHVTEGTPPALILPEI
jgi:putative phage-type endonuclease